MLRSGPACLAIALFLIVGAERANLRADLPQQSERVVHYTIRAKLSPERKEITGDMDLVWRNTCGQAVDQLYFHLYLNAFRDKDSTYLRESGGKGKRGSSFEKEYPGWVKVNKMALPDGTDLWKDGTRAFVAPDDGNEKDATLARVALPAPVPPGETVSLRIGFESRLPRVMHRTGWSGDPDDPERLFFMLAQWFPKVAVLRAGADGAPHWNAHQFHRNTEFFADYGVYQVAITVPKSYVVGATGPRVRERRDNGDGTVTVVHRQEDVHDFAWTASPQLRVATFEWDFDSFVAEAPGDMGKRVKALLARTALHLGKSPDEVKPANKVTIRILHPADHAGEVVERFRWAAGASIACYGMWFGAYPYDVLTIVDPPAGGGAAGGMEYPTLITVWGDRLAPDYASGMEGVTIHEFGHQFFYGLIGSNEFEEAWLDEGFTSYTDARVYEVAYGPGRATTRYRPFVTPYRRPFEPPAVWPRVRKLLNVGGWLDDLPYPWKKPESLAPEPAANPFWAYLRDMPALHGDVRVAVPQPLGERNWWLGSHTHDAMVMPGWHYAARGDYSVNAYGKPTLFLYCLRGMMGEPAFDRALRRYAETQRFQHPTTEDFFAAVRAEPLAETRKKLVDEFMQAMAFSASRLDAAILSAENREVGEGKWEWTVRVQRRGQIPVPIVVTVDDGSGADVTLASWISRGGETTKTFRTVQPRKMKVVRLGPDWLRNIDSDLSNNARRVEGGVDKRPAAVLAARWTLYAEEVLRAYTGVAR